MKENIKYKTINMTIDASFSINDVLENLFADEKRELVDALCEELHIKNHLKTSIREFVVGYLRDLPEYDLKCLLCDVLGVGGYMDAEALKTRLQAVLDAK